MCQWLLNLFKSTPDTQIRKAKQHLFNQYTYQAGLTAKGKILFKHLYIVTMQGFNPWTLITQTWHETAGYQSVIGKYNFWGIKKPINWEGRVVKCKTKEYINGKKITVYSEFIDFPSCTSAILWWISLIKRLYINAYNNRTDPYLFFDGLIQGGKVDSIFNYATHQDKYGHYIYDELLIRLYDSLKKNYFISRLVELCSEEF